MFRRSNACSCAGESQSFLASLSAGIAIWVLRVARPPQRRLHEVISDMLIYDIWLRGSSCHPIFWGSKLPKLYFRPKVTRNAFGCRATVHIVCVYCRGEFIHSKSPTWARPSRFCTRKVWRDIHRNHHSIQSSSFYWHMSPTGLNRFTTATFCLRPIRAKLSYLCLYRLTGRFWKCKKFRGAGPLLVEI